MDQKLEQQVVVLKPEGMWAGCMEEMIADLLGGMSADSMVSSEPEVDELVRTEINRLQTVRRWDGFAQQSVQRDGRPDRSQFLCGSDENGKALYTGNIYDPVDFLSDASGFGLRIISDGQIVEEGITEIHFKLGEVLYEDEGQDQQLSRSPHQLVAIVNGEKKIYRW